MFDQGVIPMWNFQKIDFFVVAKMVDNYVRNDVPKRFSKKKIFHGVTSLKRMAPRYAVGPARSARRSEMFTRSRYLLPTIPYSK